MIDQKIVDYIKISLAQGKTKEELYKELLEQGRAVDVIWENFNAINAEGQGKEDASKKMIRIIVTIGAVLVGVGVFSFIAANWQEISRPAKISIILIMMLMSYGIGWYLKERSNLDKIGSALFLLGFIIYGAGIFLVAQMFHMRVNWPDGFILWMFGGIAVAFALESSLYFYLAIILGIMAITGYPKMFMAEIFGYHAFLSTSSFLPLIATVITFITGWLIRKKISPEFKEFY